MRNGRYDKAKKLTPSQDTIKSKRCYNCGGKDHLSNECPEKIKGPKCFKCGEFGHVSIKCNKINKPRCDAIEANDKKTYKEVMILGKNIKAIIDTGSDLNLILASRHVQLGTPSLSAQTIPFKTVGANTHRTLRRFKASVKIDGLMFEFNFDVVPDEFISNDVLLGGELTEQAELRISGRRALLCKRVSQCKDEESISNSWRAVLNIDVSSELDDKPDVSIQHIKNPEIKSESKKLVENYVPVKSKDTGVKMCIVLHDDAPVYQNPRRLSAEQKTQVNEIIDRWISEGVVRPSVSDYASPIVLVAKKDGQPRLCVDYRSLNKKIVKDRNPLPLIEDQPDRLQNARVFSTLDLKAGFFHVPIETDSIKYTAFVVPDGQYEFMRVPFGLCNSSAVFQRHVRAVFRPLITSGTVLA